MCVGRADNKTVNLMGLLVFDKRSLGWWGLVCEGEREGVLYVTFAVDKTAL